MTFASVEEIFARIEKTRNELTGTVTTLTPEETTFQLAPEKWSVANIVEHLAKTEGSLIRLVNKLLEKAEAENVKSDGRINPPISFAETAEKARGMKFEAPDAIRPEGKATVFDSLAQLSQSRAALTELRPRLEAVDLSNVKFPHPAFGVMNLYQWLAFIGLHEERHLRQIEERIALLKEANQVRLP